MNHMQMHPNCTLIFQLPGKNTVEHSWYFDSTVSVDHPKIVANNGKQLLQLFRL